MTTNILWSGIEYHSLENCLTTATPDGIEINSTIVGTYQHKIYQITYRIKTTQEWHILSLEIIITIDTQTHHHKFETDGKGNWRTNNRPAPQFQDCLYVDIALTPFTNTLPINRLKLKIGEEHKIKVIYINPLEEEIKSLHQKYTCISPTEYNYQNVPNDFEANIKVDKLGLVVDYPGLFTRTEILTT